MTGFEVYLGERAIVHHVIAFLVEPEMIPEFEAYDDADPGPGYACFGGPTGDSAEGSGSMMGGASWLGSWAPGVQSQALPAGTGMRIEPGSKIVVQVHYHTQGGAALSDRSAIGLTLADEVEHEAMILPFTNFGWPTGSEDMTIPAGEASVTHSFTADRSDPVLNFLLGRIGAGPEDTLMVNNAGLHIHLLGRRARVAVERGGGGDDEACLVEIDDWDFNWQEAYDLVEPVALGPDDALSISCEWDNSAANQPIVDGEPKPPAEVGWGDGSFDEMCLGVLYVSK